MDADLRTEATLDATSVGGCPSAELERVLSGDAEGTFEPRRALVGATAKFAHAYLRWVDANADHGLTFVRLRLIERLNNDGPAMMRALSDELSLTPRHMTALVDALEDEKLVARRPHPTDRRATVVELHGLGVRGCECGARPEHRGHGWAVRRPRARRADPVRRAAGQAARRPSRPGPARRERPRSRLSATRPARRRQDRLPSRS